MELTICCHCRMQCSTEAELFIHEKLHSGDPLWAEWGNPLLLNSLCYIHFPIVARLMEAYRRDKEAV